MNEFTLKAEGVTISEIIEAEDLDGATEQARAWGAENGVATVGIYDGGAWLADVKIEALPYADASICVEIHRGTIDPQGLGSDEENAACEEHILDAVRGAFPGAEVRAVGNGGRTSATMRDGEDFTHEVKGVVNRAFDSFMGG